MLRTRIKTALAGAGIATLGVFGAAAPALAAPAAHTAPAFHNNCNITTQFCTILAENGLYMFGTNINQGLISHHTGDSWEWLQEDSQWGFLVNQSGDCLWWNAGVGQLQTSASCKFANGNFYFWPFASNGHEVIKIYDLGTTPNLAVFAPAGTFVGGLNGNTTATELNWE